MSQAIDIDGILVSPDHFIDGRRVSSSQTFPDHCPIDGRLIGAIAAGLPEHCDAAIEAARRAFPAWAAMGPEGRGVLLKAFAEGIRRWGDRLARVECEDNGMLLTRLRGHQVDRCAQNIAFFADQALSLQDQRIEGKNARHQLRFDPAGVCVLITPWNSPMMLTTWKLGPALAAGNTVVIKPPEWAPLTCSMLADIATEAGIPPGVINVVQGLGSSTGAALVADPRVARVSFTGSVPTAKIIGAATARNLTPTSFELGGKSPLIVLDDADLDQAAATAALQYRNAGQVCLAGTRLLVHEAVADDFLARMQAIVQGLKVGDSRDAGSLAELLAWMKATPGKAFYGIPAAGSSPHFVGMLLARAAGVEAQAVRYRGGPPMVADLLGGQVPAAVNVLGNFIEFHRSGKLRVLATSGAVRSPLLQEVPTLAELGFPQAQVDDWYGFMAKVGTPKSETTAFAAAVREVVEMRDVRAALLSTGHNPLLMNADELAKDIVNAKKRWAEVIRQTGFKLES